MKKRTSSHVLEDRSDLLLRSLLPQEWIIRKLPQDYGVDYEIEIVDQEIVSGNRIWVQLKATRSVRPYSKKKFFISDNLRNLMPGKPEFIETDYVPFEIRTNDLKYTLSCSIPLLLFVADLEQEEIFWLPLRDEVVASLMYRSPNWRSQSTATLYIPVWNKISTERKKNFPGLRWFALEPGRMYSFAIIHHYYHEFQASSRLSGYTIGDGWIDYSEQDELIESLKLARGCIQAVLELDVIFGKNGIDFFKNPDKTFSFLRIIPISIQLQEASKAVDEALQLLDAEQYTFMQMSYLVNKVASSIELLSTAISSYQGYRQRFLLTNEMASFRAMNDIDEPPSIPLKRKHPDKPS